MVVQWKVLLEALAWHLQLVAQCLVCEMNWLGRGYISYQGGISMLCQSSDCQCRDGSRCRLYLLSRYMLSNCSSSGSFFGSYGFVPSALSELSECKWGTSCPAVGFLWLHHKCLLLQAVTSLCPVWEDGLQCNILRCSSFVHRLIIYHPFIFNKVVPTFRSASNVVTPSGAVYRGVRLKILI